MAWTFGTEELRRQLKDAILASLRVTSSADMRHAERDATPVRFYHGNISALYDEVCITMGFSDGNPAPFARATFARFMFDQGTMGVRFRPFRPAQMTHSL